MKQKNWLIAGGAILGIMLLSNRSKAETGSVANISYLGKSNLPRGMRNNNPGNIRISPTAWQGKIPVVQNTDGAFEQFQMWVYGIRAMLKNLQYYQDNRGLNTIAQIISTWAPAADNNNTSAYINAVSAATGFNPNQPLNLADKNTMWKLVKAMATVENGRDVITKPQFDYAWTII